MLILPPARALPGQPGGVWGGNPIEKAGLAGIGCRGQLPQYLSAWYVPHMCGSVLSSINSREWGNPSLKSVRCGLKNGKFVLPEYSVYSCTRYTVLFF